MKRRKTTALSVQHNGGALPGSASYTYDAAGNRLTKTAVQEATPNPVSVLSQYSYDPIYELTQAVVNSSVAESYSYDAVGNRLTSAGPVTYNNNSSNELTSSSLATYAYDSNANTLSKTTTAGTTSYTWDFENRLSSVTLPGTGGTVNFSYDLFGRRIEKVAPTTGTTIYAYDGANVTDEFGVAGNLLAQYAQGAGIDEPLTMTGSGRTYYYHTDGLGSIASLTNRSGQLANSYAYDSFGNLTASTGTIPNPFEYTGREFESETGLYYYRARYYDEAAGRFINEDSKKSTADINFYRYSLNSPVNRVDPLGWSSCQSGRCADCPGGRWVSGAVTAEAYVSLRFASGGGLLFSGVMLCPSNPTFNVPFTTLCGFFFGGLSPRPPLTSPPAKPIGFGAGLGGAFLTCSGAQCREDLAGPEKGWYAQFGPAYYFKEGGSGGVSCQGGGVGFDLGLGGGLFKCNTWIGPSIGGIE